MPERERLILRLRFEHDLTQSEIAKRVGISKMHVSRLLRRSLATRPARAQKLKETSPQGTDELSGVPKLETEPERTESFRQRLSSAQRPRLCLTEPSSREELREQRTRRQQDEVSPGNRPECRRPRERNTLTQLGHREREADQPEATSTEGRR